MASKKSIDHTALLVLALLCDTDMYGYQMIAELEKRSDHTFDMKEGTLYPILHGLENQGAVESYRAPSTAGRERKYYRLTGRGADLLKAEEEAWQRYAGAVNAVLQSAKPARGMAYGTV